jgi:hypothetical protein
MSLKTFLVVFLFIFFSGVAIFLKEVMFDKISNKFDPVDILLQLERAPDVYMDAATSVASDVHADVKIDSDDCHFFNCFNIYRCVDHSGKQGSILLNSISAENF